MHPETFLSYKEIAKLPEQVNDLCLRLGIPIKAGADLAKLLKVAVSAETNRQDTLELCLAHRVLRAILACKNEANLKEPLSRIASNTLAPASTEHSPGKEALFELEMLQYIKYRGVTSRLDEPDIVITAPFGEYFIACKTINSLNNFEGQLRSGCKQVEKRGNGCVAFNLEPHVFAEQPVHTNSAKTLRQSLDSYLRGLYGNVQRFFDARLESERIDGVMLQISCFAEVADSPSAMDVFTHTVFYSRFHTQGKAARERFDGFRQTMLGPLGF